MRTFGKACFGTGGSLCRVGGHIVTECFDFFLALDMIATRTILVCCVTWLGAGCGLAVYVNKIMTKCLDKLNLTYGTNLRIFTICFCAGSMSKFRNSLLCLDYLITNRAMLSFGKTGVFASRSNRRINYLGVTLGRNDFLLNKYLLTLSANLTFGESAFGTGRILGRKNSCIKMSAFSITNKSAVITALIVFIVVYMRDYGSNVLLNKNFATSQAMLTLGKTRRGTGCINRRVDNLGVSLCGSKLNLTYGTNLRIFAISLRTCGMSLRRNSLLCYDNLIANATMLTLGKTCLGTGCINRLVDNLGVTLGRSKLYLTYGTNLCVKTICLITCSMSKCSNSLLINFIVASIAMLSLCQTVFCTGGGLSTINNNIMIECRNLLLLYKDFSTILT